MTIYIGYKFIILGHLCLLHVDGALLIMLIICTSSEFGGILDNIMVFNIYIIIIYRGIHYILPMLW